MFTVMSTNVGVVQIQLTTNNRAKINTKYIYVI